MDRKDKELLRRLYLEEGKSCSEAVFEAVLEAHGVVPEERCFRMMRGFSGGLSCGLACGAVTGGVAAISYLFNNGGESYEEVQGLCGSFAQNAMERFGTIECNVLKHRHRREDTRCYELVEQIADILWDTIGPEKEESE